MPEKIALGTDWDQIGEQFTAVRGIGYVAWYPVAVNAVSMSEGNTVFDAIARWQERSRECVMTVHFNRIANGSVVSNGPRTQNAISFSDLTRTVPTFAVGEFEVLDRPALTIYYLPQHSSISRDWALAIEKIAPTISQWFGPPKKKVTVIDLADETASAFGSGAELFVPLRSSTPEAVQQQIAPTLTHAAVVSHRRWIDEGLAQFAQMLAVENTSGQKAALAQLRRFGDALAQAEEPQPRGESAEAPRPTEPQPLITTADPAFYRIKATFVWWMLRDMLGEEPLQHALSSYRAADDKEPSYMQRILELEAKHSLEQFFDDWVYRDRGLPDFKIESVYPRQTLAGSYVATVTVVNAGQAGAEVPVRVRAAQGERTARLLVPAGQKATVRVELAAYPTEVVVNDGSVPESDASNNSLTVPPQTK
jgi:hypothetical protein